MKRILLLIGLMTLSGSVFASSINYSTVWATNGQVTAVNLNGNFNNVSSVVNGGLDNTNANTSAGYRFYQTVSVLPSAGNTGQVYYLTTDNSLNFDTGSTFIKTIGIGGSSARGNVIYYGASGLGYLVNGTSGYPLISNGVGSDPTYASLTTVATVAGTALSGLSGINSNAGVIPVANIPVYQPFTTQSVVTGSRALSTPYQNTTGKTMFVTVAITGGSSIGGLTAYSSSINPPTGTTIVASNVLGNNGVSSISFIVLSGNYYEVIGGIAVSSWTEWY